MPKVVVIPIYKSIPNKNEIISFKQAIKVLGKHDICIVTYAKLDISYYCTALNEKGVNYWVENFDKEYFGNLQTYSRLLLKEGFYRTFVQYKYMLVYQLDCYVFSDQLNDWCNKGYDYIGSPWFKRFRTHHTQGKLAAVGNGGFSLRNIQSFLAAFEYSRTRNKTISLFNFWNIYEMLECNKLSFKLVKERLLGKENNLHYYLQSSIQEDVVWSQIVPEAVKTFKVAPVKEAISFAFESDPIFLFEQNNRKLPFGCHAWHKHQYNEFWSKHIHAHDD